LSSPKGRLTCEITDVFFASSIVNAKGYLRLPGVPGMHASAPAEPRMVEAEGGWPWSKAPEASDGVYTDKLENQPKYPIPALTYERPNRAR
jgi:hypothetical protein